MIHASKGKRVFVALLGAQLPEWLARQIDAVDLPVLMINGIHFRGRVVLVALGFDSQGRKDVLGIRECSTEKTAVVKASLSELIARGLDAEHMLRWIIVDTIALRHAIADVLGSGALVQRCQAHKRKNVLDSLPDEVHASVGRATTEAWARPIVVLAKRQLERLASSLANVHVGAAARLREGLEETLTVIDLGLDAALYRRFTTTNPIGNLTGSIPQFIADVKRWRDDRKVLRWIGAALTDASHRFRSVRGDRYMKHLMTTLGQRAEAITTVDRKPAHHVGPNRHCPLVQKSLRTSPLAKLAPD